jgi:O-antigen ligase
MITWPVDKENLQKHLQKFVSIVILLLPCSFILRSGVPGVIIALVVVLWLVLSILSTERFRFRFSESLFAKLYLLYFIINLLSLLYSENFRYGIKHIESKLALLIFPLIFFSGYNILSNVDLRKVLFAFAQSICVTCFFVILRIIWISDDLITAWNEYTFIKLSGIMSIHPGYFSLYICFSVLILLSHFNFQSRAAKILIGVELAVLAIFIFRLTSRMPIFGLVICLLVYIFFEKKFKLLLVCLIAGSLTFFLLTESNPDIRERFLRPLKMIGSGDVKELQRYATDRQQIYSCAIELLSRPTTLLVGKGIGDANQALIDCYDQHGYTWVSSRRYNAHNEYFQSTLEVGIAGGLIFALLLIIPLRYWTFQKEFLMFAILFGVFSLTESTLQVQKGIVFFSFFHSLFASFANEFQQNKK